MGTVYGLPPQAFKDIASLISLDQTQLESLIKAFGTPDSVPPRSQSFIEQLSERLGIGEDTAPGIYAASLFLLSLGEMDNDSTSEIVDTVKASILGATEDKIERDELERKIGENRELLESLATPTPAWRRHRKIRTLVKGPERSAEGFRTICQLRPLFEGPEGDEAIEGLVPVILMEIETSSSDDDCKSITFALPEKKLQELKQVIERAEAKMNLVRQQYGKHMLTVK